VALDDQDFTRPDLVLLGPEFFNNPTTGQPDYVFAIEFREAPIHHMFDFHFVALDRPEVKPNIEVLQAWGVPVQMGELFTPDPRSIDVRRMSRLVVSCLAIHSNLLTQAYRQAGRKIISAIDRDLVLSALTLAATDPEPDAFHKHLRELTLNGY